MSTYFLDRSQPQAVAFSVPEFKSISTRTLLVFKSARTPAYPGETPPHRQYRLTPEFYYGITPTLELGLYLLASRAAESLRLDRLFRHPVLNAGELLLSELVRGEFLQARVLTRAKTDNFGVVAHRGHDQEGHSR